MPLDVISTAICGGRKSEKVLADLREGCPSENGPATKGRGNLAGDDAGTNNMSSGMAQVRLLVGMLSIY